MCEQTFSCHVDYLSQAHSSNRNLRLLFDKTAAYIVAVEISRQDYETAELIAPPLPHAHNSVKPRRLTEQVTKRP